MWIKGDYINQFLNNNNYSIKVSGNGRWIDQKCTPDVVSIVSDCILEFAKSNPCTTQFSSLDIWHSKYTENNILSIFKKPGTENKNARNEYDKFFQQPMEMLAYSKVLTKRKDGKRNYYSINEHNILEFLSMGEKNALIFLQFYIEKVLSDSGIINVFNDFFDNPNQRTYEKVKDIFTLTTKQYTKINGDTESWRIFTKVINPLAFKYNSEGTERGRISRDKISYDMLMYNRDNFRDVFSQKPRGLTRDEYALKKKTSPNQSYFTYCSSKAKKYLRSFNDTFRNGKSEIDDENNAVQIHHIFPESQFPDICGFYENLIALTPNQHFINAHPNGNTAKIDRGYQYRCLQCKLRNICSNSSSCCEDHIYDKDRFLKVLDIGLETDEFEQINNFSYDNVLNLLNKFYSDVIC